jgi:hypothetical protein
MLTFPAIHGKLDRVAIGAMKRLIAMEHNLDEVVARRNLSQVSNRITKSRIIDNYRLSGTHGFHIHPEHHLRAWRIIDLHPRLVGGIV